MEMPDRIEIPLDYFPDGIGPGTFDPLYLKIAAEAYNRGKYMHEMTIKSWVVLWLLDHVDWSSVATSSE